MSKSGLYKFLALFFVAILLSLWALAFYWSREPVGLDIKAITQEESEKLGILKLRVHIRRLH